MASYSRYRKSSVWSRAIPAALALVFALTFPALSTRDGNGGYSLPSNSFSVPVTGGTLIASEAAAVWADITTAIAGSVASDGQSTMSGNLKMGAQRITGLAEGSAATDATTVNQIQDGAMSWGGVAGGTADALTLALSPVVTAYVDGMTIYFVSSASPNTGATTVNVNSVATDAILKNGAALAAGDIAASKVYAITYYNSDWHLWSPLSFTLASNNTWTGTNTFSAAVTANAALNATSTFTLSSTDAGAGGGPYITALRDSASPAASDIIGGLLMSGKDSGGTTTSYAFLDGTILDATDTSEDARIRWVAQIAGTPTVVMNLGPGIQVASPTGGDKGVGTVNAQAGLYIAGHGTVAQFVEDEDAVYQTLGTILPLDDTIPQNTEGDELLTVAITPTNASSTLSIMVEVQGQLAVASGDWACAVFVDTTADAIAARAASVVSTSNIMQLTFTHTLSAGSTSARTYKVRCGSAVATDLKVNGTNTARLFGGVNQSRMSVTEILPQ
jgi:hypothetical protein